MLKVNILRLLRQQRLKSVLRLLRSGESALSVADGEQCNARFDQRCALAAAQLGAQLPGPQQLLLQLACTIENVLDCRGRDADHVAEFLSEVENETIRRAGRERQRLL